MKSFENILGMSQMELKIYLKKYLSSCGYKTIDEDGFLYAKGEVPVLLVAHMDRHPTHKSLVKEIMKAPYLVNNKTEERWSSPQGICGDDRCGVWTIMNVVKESKCSVLFCEDEELGCVGSSKFTKTKYIKDLNVNYMIQIDRHGSNDCVFYSCDNKKFTEWIEKNSGRKTAIGSCSDISYLMPSSGIAGVNFSCGYYNEHTSLEYIVMEELEQTIEMIKKLVKVESEKFEYVKKQYSYGSWGGYYGGYSRYTDDDDYYMNRYSSKSQSKKKTIPKISDYDRYVTLVVTLSDDYGGEEMTVTGNNKMEAWFNLFFENEDLCWAMIGDYYYE